MQDKGRQRVVTAAWVRRAELQIMVSTKCQLGKICGIFHVIEIQIAFIAPIPAFPRKQGKGQYSLPCAARGGGLGWER